MSFQIKSGYGQHSAVPSVLEEINQPVKPKILNSICHEDMRGKDFETTLS